MPTDLLGGLNEGVWPASRTRSVASPKVRATWSAEARISHRLIAHDFASALGAPEVLITRARRDSRSPTVASRFWLRLDAMTGGFRAISRSSAWPRRSTSGPPCGPPGPSPPAEQRPAQISVTSVDRLKADPFAFYAN